ncbi:MAG: polysaccharide deacetylase family protein [Coriobacteriia bacterium]|nr:polysaccharide deacetylase family protein [Coriobacteriia bacterium]
MPDRVRSTALRSSRPKRQRPVGLIVAVVAVVSLVLVGAFGARWALTRSAEKPGISAAQAAVAVAPTSGVKAKPLAAPSSSAPTSATASAPAEVANPALDQAVPVLMYHHILPVPSNFIAISPATFDAQMKYLHDNGWHAISIAQLQEFVETGKRLPSKPVLITFDDDRMNQLTYGVPILKKYGFTATFFVVQKWINSTSQYFMHVPQLKQLQADGYDLESHTTNHMMMYRFHSKSTGKFESLTSMKTRMWDPTNGMRVWMNQTFGGQPVTALAYPGGGNDSFTWQIVKDAGYHLAFTTDTGYVTYKGSNPMALPRWNTGARGTTMATFASIMNGAAHFKPTK